MKRLAICALFGVAILARTAAADTIPTLALGAVAPAFSLPGVDGRTWSLDDFRSAKVLVVVFTCNHCPTAQYYEDRLKRFAEDYREKGAALVAIMPNDPKSVRLDELGWTDMSDSFEEMKVRARDHHFNFPYLYDGDTEAVSRAYGPAATPHVFVFDSARKLRYVGAIDDAERVERVTKPYLRHAVDALLAGRQPAVTQTKVVGCSTKWAGKADSVREYLEKLAVEPVSLAPADAAALGALRQNDSGKFRLVNFWATWCAPCVAEFHEFVTINRMYRHRDFELVTVSLNEPGERDTVLAFLRKREASNRNVILASRDRETLLNAFDRDWSGAVPYTVLINPEGRIVYSEIGSIDPLAVKRAIVKALNERKPW